LYADGKSRNGHRIAKRTDVSDLPLSFAQQRLWFLDQLEPESAFYNLPAALELTGALNVIALERALSEVVKRHEVLRTSFVNVEGWPVQVISNEASIFLPVIVSNDLPEADKKVRVERLTIEESQSPFNLSRGPLLRAKLLRLGETEHVLLFTMH